MQHLCTCEQTWHRLCSSPNLAKQLPFWRSPLTHQARHCRGCWRLGAALLESNLQRVAVSILSCHLWSQRYALNSLSWKNIASQSVKKKGRQVHGEGGTELCVAVWLQVMTWWPFRNMILKGRSSAAESAQLKPLYLFHFGDATPLIQALQLSNRLTGCALVPMTIVHASLGKTHHNRPRSLRTESCQYCCRSDWLA